MTAHFVWWALWVITVFVSCKLSIDYIKKRLDRKERLRKIKKKRYDKWI